MATEGVLLPVNMSSFNPFRSSPSHPPSPAHPPRAQVDDTENDDSWHTNASSHVNGPQKAQSPSNKQSSSALSWFSSWTSSTTITGATKTTTTTASAEIAIQDDRPASAHPPPPSSSHPPISSPSAPAKSITMNRGMDHAHIDPLTDSPDAPLRNKLGGCIPNIQPNGSIRLSPSRNAPLAGKSAGSDNGVDDIERFDLPDYPEPKTPLKQPIQSTSRTKEELLLDFPFPGTKPRLSKVPPKSTSIEKPAFDKEETTFPGFALFQTAKAQYFLRKYSEALDTTTNCLASQKASMGGHAGASPVPSASKHEAASPKVDNSAKAVGIMVDGNGSSTTAMMPLDLRSQFVTGVSSSVLGVVQSLKEKDANEHHHPMLSNSIAIMVAQYPSYPCVAQTLFLRGRLLAECGKKDGDFSLLEQAAQHVEMAVAIYRKLHISDEELATFLISLGNMRVQLGQFDIADAAYEEAVSILRDDRSGGEHYHAAAMKAKDEDLVSDCATFLKRINREFSTALYLHGISYHCQRLHGSAFACYSKALILLKKAGASRRSRGVRRIARRMKNRCALEKLVSTYWDDDII
ncbi:hypothetical protein ACHAXT_004128 [Thalassiosira profunda]